MISRSEATLVVASGILLGLFLFFRPPSGRAFEGELVGVVENAVEDCIGEVLVGEVLVPGVRWKLAGDPPRMLHLQSRFLMIRLPGHLPQRRVFPTEPA